MIPAISRAAVIAPMVFCWLGLLLLVGCGESLEERMRRQMKARAAMKAEAEAAAAAAAETDGAAPPATAEPPPLASAEAADGAADEAAEPATPRKATAAASEPVESVAAAASSEDRAPEDRALAPPDATETPSRMAEGSRPDAAVAPGRADAPAADGPSREEHEPVESARDPKRSTPAARLVFHPAATSLVWQGAEAGNAWQTWGLLGDEQAALQPAREFQPEGFPPTCFAWDPAHERLFVGGADGRSKYVYPGTLDPFDHHRRARIRWEDNVSGWQAHPGALTALAVARQGALLASGDAAGTVRLWAADPEQRSSISAGESPVIACQPYGNEGLLLGLTETGQAVSVRLEAGKPRIRPYAEFASRPTVMQVGRSGQGLVVGESDGRVTVWAPAQDGLQKASVQAHAEPVVGAALLRDDATLVTASAEGTITRWNLPLPAWRRLPIAQPRPEFLAVDRQGQRLAVPGRAGSVEIYEVGAAEPAGRLTLTEGQLATAAVFSEDGTRLAVGDQAGNLHLFGVETKGTAAAEPLGSQSLGEGAISAVVASPAQPHAFCFGTAEGGIGKFAFAADSGSAGTAEDAEADPGDELEWMQQLNHPVGPLALGRKAEELWCATPAGGMQRFSLDSGDERTALPPVGSRIRQIVPFGDAGHAVLVGDDSRLRVYGGEGQLAEDLPADEPIRALAASPSGDQLAAITRSNQLISWDWHGEASVPSVLALDFSADDLAFAGEARWVLSPAADAELRIGSTATRRVELPVAPRALTDIAVLASETAIALADGSERVELVDLQGQTQGGWRVDGFAVQRLAAASQTPRLAAVGLGPRAVDPIPGRAAAGLERENEAKADTPPAANGEAGSEPQLLIGLPSASAPEHRLSLPAQGIALAFDATGERVAVALANQQVWLVDAVAGQWLETITTEQPLRSIAFSARGDELLVGTADGIVQRQSIRTRGAFDAHAGGIVQLLAAGADGLVSAGTDGEIKRWGLAAPSSSSSVTSRILRSAAPERVRGLAVSRDGRRVVALVEGSPGQLPVWQLDRSVGSGALAAEQPERPWAVIEPTGNATTAALSPAGETLAVGHEDGTIAVHALPEGKVVATMNGHRGAVLGLQWTPTGRRLLSGGTDQTVHVWELPTEGQPQEPVSLDAIRTVRLRSVDRAAGAPSVPTLTADAKSAEALIWQQLRGRVANHAVPRDGTLFSEYPGDPAAKQLLQERFTAWRGEERATWSHDAISMQQLAALAQARSRFFEQRRQLLPHRPDDAAADTSTPANLLFSTPANDSHSPPAMTSTITTATMPAAPQVAVSLAGFLYRLQPADTPSGRNGNPTTAGARLQTWDFGYSGLELNDWTDRAGRLQRLIPATDDQAVFTLPSLTRFAHHGEARPLIEVASFAAAPAGLYGNRAVWAMAPQPARSTSAPSPRSAPTPKSAPPLGIFGGDRWLALLKELPKDLQRSEVRVTAIAFAHQHRRLAFCIGDASRQRLYLADPTNLRPDAWQLLAEFEPDADTAATRRRQPIQGPPRGLNALAFAPNDSLLVGHGRFDNAEYRLHGWKLVWRANSELQTPARDERAEEAFEPIVQQNTPLIEENSQPTLRFILPRREGSALGRLVTGRTRGIAAATAWMVAEVEQGIAVSDVRRQQQKRLVAFPEEGPRPVYALSADGRWMLQATDGGQVRLHNLYTGVEASLTADDRPAHPDAVTALAFSEVDPRLGFPAYAASVGRDGQVRVWDLIQPVVTHFLGSR